MIPFAAIITPESIVFTDTLGKTNTITSDDAEKFSSAKDLIKQLQLLKYSGAEEGNEDFQFLHQKLVDLLAPPQQITDQIGVAIVDGVVYYDGKPFHSVLTERILWGISEGFDMNPYVYFFENLMQNPSKRAVDELFSFIERHKMGITSDGFILAYKRVTDDFKDIFTKKIDNSPGQYVEMNRNEVNDDPNQTCSSGLHFCSIDYLPHYGSYQGSKVIIVKVNPKDVVSVPIDYDAAKVRCCAYEVISEYTGSDRDDLLKTKAVWNNSDFSSNDEPDENEEYEDDDYWNDTDGALVNDDYVPTNDDTEYDRGYDFGYSKGLVDAEEHKSQPDDILDGSSDSWCHGFSAGWRDGVETYLLEHFAENETEDLLSDSEQPANYDTGVVFDGDTLQPSDEGQQETVVQFPVVPFSPEKDVRPLSATPLVTTASGFITVTDVKPQK